MQVEPRSRFDNFVVGSANRLAVAAARAVAESPGGVYNPLFIYGSSGLGKTHLIGAIGNEAVERAPELNVEYLSLEDFIEQIHAAVAVGEMERFKQRYGRVDVLLLDDMQFLTGRRETQSELLRLLNALQQGGRQIVMTSDRPPSEIPDVDERLISRLSGGLIVDIGVPDFETKVAILRGKSEERKVSFAPGVIEELARLDFTSVRELQGAMGRLVAQQSLDGTLTPAQVRAVLGADAGVAEPEPIPQSEPEPASNLFGGSAGDEFFSFVTNIATTVAAQIEPWKVRVGETVAYWAGEGYRTAVLERLMAEPVAPAQLRGAAARLWRTRSSSSASSRRRRRRSIRIARRQRAVSRSRSGSVKRPRSWRRHSRAPCLRRVRRRLSRGATFQESASNQMAVRAADAVIAEPGQRYNPLFIAGPSGTREDASANAIGNELARAADGTMRVACVGAQLFIDELIAALQEGQIGGSARATVRRTRC